jgi:hypothetical protein
MCGQGVWRRPSDARFAGCGLAAAGACSGVWGGGFGVLAGGPPARCGWGYAVPRSGSVGLVVDGQHLFMVRGSGYNMMKPALARKVSWSAAPGRMGGAVPVHLSCQRGRGHCPHLRLPYGIAYGGPHLSLRRTCFQCTCGLAVDGQGHDVLALGSGTEPVSAGDSREVISVMRDGLHGKMIVSSILGPGRTGISGPTPRTAFVPPPWLSLANLMNRPADNRSEISVDFRCCHLQNQSTSLCPPE